EDPDRIPPFSKTFHEFKVPSIRAGADFIVDKYAEDRHASVPCFFRPHRGSKNRFFMSRKTYGPQGFQVWVHTALSSLSGKTVVMVRSRYSVAERVSTRLSTIR